MCPTFIKYCKETCYIAGCTAVEISGCSYANCDGVYALISNHSVGGHPFYLNTQNHRVMAMYGDRWACRPESNGLPTSTYYEISKYSIIKIKFSIVYIYIFDVIGIGPANYPWLAEWNDDIEVKCVQGMVQGKF